MKQILIARALEFLFSMFEPDEIREYLDDVLDKIEDKYQDAGGSKAATVMAVVGLTRKMFAIPDDIGGDPD